MKIIYTVLGIALLTCLLPLLLPLTASFVAHLAGCELDTGSTSACVIAGMDFGETLYFAFMLHWLGIMTMPFAALIMVLLAITGMADVARRIYRRVKQKP